MIDHRFESGARDPWQLPEEVMRALALTGQEVAIDLGAGSGYFARHLAPRVRRLIAVEPEPAYRARLSEYDAVAEIREIAEEVDLVFAANVLRFLRDEDRDHVRRLTRRVVLIDWRKDPRPVGPPESEAILPAAAIAAFPGFRAGPSHDFLPYQWMIELERVD